MTIVFVVVENDCSLDQAMALAVVLPVAMFPVRREFSRFWRLLILLLLSLEPAGNSILFVTLSAREVLGKVFASHRAIHGPLRRLTLFAKALVVENYPLAYRRIDSRMRTVERAEHLGGGSVR